MKDFITNHHNISDIHRIPILHDVVNGLAFLHSHHVVHGDMKPENIVSFSNGVITRWKIVDFDTSFIEGNPEYSQSNINNLRCTPEYSSPELIQTLSTNQNNSNNNLNNLLNWRVDIWSLGLISIFILKGCSLWSLLYPHRDFDISMLNNFTDDLLKRILVSEKFINNQKSFIESCLNVDPNSRLSCDNLRMKSLFTTGTSTISVDRLNNLNRFENKIDEGFKEGNANAGELLNQMGNMKTK